uniref:Uncharacterized protein n=1 Tax=Acrobeloides nanus TaxID=290746 RepID=A0A914C9C3_9BILA
MLGICKDERRDERRHMVKRWEVNQEREVIDRPILNLRAKREWGERREGRREERRDERREGRREEFNRERGFQHGWGR